MNNIHKVRSFLKEDLTLTRLVKTIAVLLIVFLISQTWSVWSTLLRYIFSSLKPFLIGFIIAYIASPLVDYLESKKIRKSLAITLIIVLTLIIFGWILFTLFPMFNNEIGAFLNSISDSIATLEKIYLDSVANPSEIFTQIINQVAKSFAGIQSQLLDFMRVFITDFISGSISFFTTSLFSLTIAIYMLSDFQKFKERMKTLSTLISDKLPLYLTKIDEDMSTYIQSSLILMMIYFVEYTFIFYIMGHKGYLMIGLLYILGTLVPYVGGMIVTFIGILTGLTMPRQNLIILIVLVMIMSQIDGYVTSPFVYKKGVKIDPLTGLLIVFIGSAFAGAIGVMIAMPLYIAVRAAYKTFKEENILEIEEFEDEKSI